MVSHLNLRYEPSLQGNRSPHSCSPANRAFFLFLIFYFLATVHFFSKIIIINFIFSLFFLSFSLSFSLVHTLGSFGFDEFHQSKM
jgi:hypothetical protein